MIKYPEVFKQSINAFMHERFVPPFLLNYIKKNCLVKSLGKLVNDFSVESIQQMLLTAEGLEKDISVSELIEVMNKLAQEAVNKELKKGDPSDN